MWYDAHVLSRDYYVIYFACMLRHNQHAPSWILVGLTLLRSHIWKSITGDWFLQTIVTQSIFEQIRTSKYLGWRESSRLSVGTIAEAIESERLRCYEARNLRHGSFAIWVGELGLEDGFFPLQLAVAIETRIQMRVWTRSTPHKKCELDVSKEREMAVESCFSSWIKHWGDVAALQRWIHRTLGVEL